MYYCSTEWHLGQQTEADYYIMLLIPMKEIGSKMGPTTLYRPDDSLTAWRFAVCAKHLPQAIEHMEKDSAGPFLVRSVRDAS